MFDAIVLAGGRARRLDGAAKPQLLVAGVRLIDHVLAAVARASTIVAVGPKQTTATPVLWCRESPPGGGPVAAIAAGLERTDAPAVLLLGADLPFVAPAVPLLLAALDRPGAGLAHLVDGGGRANHLAAAWTRPALLAALGRLGDPAGASMGRLSSGVRAVAVDDPYGWGRDCDTWDDVRDARRRAEGVEPG